MTRVIDLPHAEQIQVARTTPRGRAISESKRQHGESLRGSRSPEYATWASIRRRCYNPKQPAYEFYGGAGIRMADEWLGPGGFERFLAHVGRRPTPQHSIDRYPNQSGNYEPGNVRWATIKEQQRNRRSNHLITIGDRTLCAAAWAEESGVRAATILARIRRHNWPPQEAVWRPADKTRPRRLFPSDPMPTPAAERLLDQAEEAK